jgi:hypothetical protein
MTQVWIGLTALAIGIMAGSLSLLCVFALEVRADEKSPVPAQEASAAGSVETGAELPIPQPFATIHGTPRGSLSA